MHMLDSNSSVDMVYLDFSKTFDKVDLSDPITCSFSDHRGRACVVCHSGAGRLGTLL